MLSRAAGRNLFNSSSSSCRRALSSPGQPKEDPALTSLEVMKETDIRSSAGASYRELSTHDKMNDYFIRTHDAYRSPDPVDPARRQPLLENVVVSQYESEAASIDLSGHMYPNVPRPGLAAEGLPYAWLNTRSFDSLRQAKFASDRLLAAHPSRRHYHRPRALQGVQTSVRRANSPLTSAGAPQGIQGDGCAHHELWQRTCGALFSRCLPPQAEDGERKTLAELFAEQLARIEGRRQ